MTAPLVVRVATAADADAVMALLRQRVAWLSARGSDQWSTWTRWPAKLPQLIADHAVWALEEADTLVGTITLETTGDADFWTPAELAEPALYLSKLATLPSHAGGELGALLLDWACDHAYRRGIPLVRLDAWRTNTALHDYYLRRGWTYLRTEIAPGRQSGTLFVRPAQPMPPATAARLSGGGDGDRASGTACYARRAYDQPQTDLGGAIDSI